MADLKFTFLMRALIQYNQEVSAAMKLAMSRKKVHVTGEGAASIAYKTAALGAGATSSLSFKEYLRFVDMGVGRGHPLGGLTTTKVSLQSRQKEGLAFIKDRTFKPKKIYATVIYGRLTYLQNRLLYGYTEATIAALKAELEPKNTN